MFEPTFFPPYFTLICYKNAKLYIFMPLKLLVEKVKFKKYSFKHIKETRKLILWKSRNYKIGKQSTVSIKIELCKNVLNKNTWNVSVCMCVCVSSFYCLYMDLF